MTDRNPTAIFIKQSEVIKNIIILFPNLTVRRICKTKFTPKSSTNKEI